MQIKEKMVNLAQITGEKADSKALNVVVLRHGMTSVAPAWPERWQGEGASRAVLPRKVVIGEDGVGARQIANGRKLSTVIIFF
jgi:hypothetical protein